MLITQDSRIRGVDGLVTSNEEVRKLTLDRGAANKKVDCGKKEYCKFRSVKARSATVVIHH
jgi:hypothetical protein